MPRSNYIIQTAEGSSCGNCNKTVSLLCKELLNGPMFYICWNCQTVAQVGIGMVRKES